MFLLIDKEILAYFGRGNEPGRSLFPGNPQNWRPSLTTGGNPGIGSNTTTFSGSPDEDLDGDNLTALVEYALGTSDSVSTRSPMILSAGTFSFPKNLAAEDVQIIVDPGPSHGSHMKPATIAK